MASATVLTNAIGALNNSTKDGANPSQEDIAQQLTALCGVIQSSFCFADGMPGADEPEADKEIKTVEEEPVAKEEVPPVVEAADTESMSDDSAPKDVEEEAPKEPEPEPVAELPKTVTPEPEVQAPPTPPPVEEKVEEKVEEDKEAEKPSPPPAPVKKGKNGKIEHGLPPMKPLPALQPTLANRKGKKKGWGLFKSKN